MTKVRKLEPAMGPSFCSQTLTDLIHNFSTTGKNAERRELSPVHDHFAVNQDRELAVMTADHLHLGLELAPNPRRHPDGMNAGYSVDAVPERYSRHMGHRSFRLIVPPGDRASASGRRSAYRRSLPVRVPARASARQLRRSSRDVRPPGWAGPRIWY